MNWRDALTGGVYMVALIFWLGPLAFGLFDIGCWFFVSHQCSSVDWEGSQGIRGGFVVLWTFSVPFVFFSIGGLS